jgi:hypothetical protein
MAAQALPAYAAAPDATNARIAEECASCRLDSGIAKALVHLALQGRRTGDADRSSIARLY